jgi:hypothetical protein
MCPLYHRIGGLSIGFWKFFEKFFSGASEWGKDEIECNTKDGYNGIVKKYIERASAEG